VQGCAHAETSIRCYTYMQGPDKSKCQKARKGTHRTVGGLDGPANLESEPTDGEQEEEQTALGLLGLLLALPIVVVEGRHGLLE
jgi:hypothetical protein